MSGGIEFPAAAVLQHAAAVSEASDRMAQAKSAVREVTMDSQAYGQLCQFLPGLLSPLFGHTLEVINDAVDALGETALKLRATAASMEAADAGSVRRLDDSAGPGLNLPL
ncbi:hypothetical protein ACFQFC_20865 [Amorphoplanes digitatis]|uniref:ESX-1 secretion-associated protein n=1 Tax=Actinoplanes digitatis TaxID=1868 RepID=A0A7W7MTQ6_9ACTN|nr:hypothetical protein [Actinoplanes digitatis]MBB4766671.1 hypothetical protein [Actinoplanes digitatis]BFE76809.1 hypothetical protein GCM10020092_101100 [Actinoplanes digitatis]GID96173.1 hypothetical protein Adi01nite_55850 [Actinoplanes digitatis]